MPTKKIKFNDVKKPTNPGHIYMYLNRWFKTKRINVIEIKSIITNYVHNMIFERQSIKYIDTILVHLNTFKNHDRIKILLKKFLISLKKEKFLNRTGFFFKLILENISDEWFLFDLCSKIKKFDTFNKSIESNSIIKPLLMNFYVSLKDIIGSLDVKYQLDPIFYVNKRIKELS